MRLELQTLLREVLDDRRPCMIVLAGSNGAGKSTFFREFLEPTGIAFVNADRMARSLNPVAPGSVGYEAARIAEAVRQDLVSRGQSFCMETVLSDPAGDKVAFLRTAQSKGYLICLIYIRLASVELSRARVQQRVNEGGHDVPDDKLDARFERTRRNAANALRIADVGFLLDNSSVENPFRHLETWKAGVCVDTEESPEPLTDSAPPADAIQNQTATLLTERLREQTHRREAKQAELLQRSIQTGVPKSVRRSIVDLRANSRGFQYEFSPQLVSPDGSVVTLYEIQGKDLNPGVLAAVERTAIEFALQSLSLQSDLSALRFAMFNLSVGTVAAPDFVDWLIATAAQRDIPCRLLCVQCREPEVVDALELLLPATLRLQQIGCRFSVSHFGSGYNSLSYLRRLPCGFLTVDSEFVRKIVTEQTDQAIVKAIADLAHTLGQLVIADGVRDTRGPPILQSLGVDFMIAAQGD